MTATVITILATVFASSGFWSLLIAFYNNKKKSKSAETEMLIGLAHDRIFELCRGVLKSGEMTDLEYDNIKRLYDPYIAMGGNGTAAKLMREVEDLKISLVTGGGNNDNE